eukprot:5154877-Pyramimonas_sp.AAC.1
MPSISSTSPTIIVAIRLLANLPIRLLNTTILTSRLLINCPPLPPPPPPAPPPPSPVPPPLLLSISNSSIISGSYDYYEWSH